jgi:hypothetical protein
MHDPTCDTALDQGLNYQGDNYAEISSSDATDYNVGDTTFSGGDNKIDKCMSRLCGADLVNIVTGSYKFAGKYHISLAGVDGT